MVTSPHPGIKVFIKNGAYLRDNFTHPAQPLKFIILFTLNRGKKRRLFWIWVTIFHYLLTLSLFVRGDINYVTCLRTYGKDSFFAQNTHTQQEQTFYGLKDRKYQRQDIRSRKYLVLRIQCRHRTNPSGLYFTFIPGWSVKLNSESKLCYLS